MTVNYNAEFFIDGQQRRVALWNQTNAVLENLLKGLPSNYLSTIPAPNYALFQKLLAEESGLSRITHADIQNDGYYETTRATFLYQILGYLLHGTQVEKFFPPNYSDEQYHRFLLALKTTLLGGSRAQNIEDGVKIFTQLPLNVVEIFKLIPPYGTSTRFDISDQFGWYFEIDVPDLGVFDLAGLEGGINFLARLIKPAHTWYEIRIIYHDTYYTTGHCITLLGNTGYLKAWRILVYHAPNPNLVLIDGVVENTVKNHIVSISALNLRVGNNVLVSTDGDTVITDDLGNTLTFNDLNVDDLIYVEGLIVDAPINSAGFYNNLKVTPTAICDRDKLSYFDYAYDDARKCCDDFKEVHRVLNEDITGKNKIINSYPVDRVFYTLYGPFTDHLGNITENTNYVIVRVNGVQVAIQQLFTYDGAILLAVAPPVGATVTVSYWYFDDPYTVAHLNTFGQLLNDYNNDIIGRVPQNMVLSPAPATTCHPTEITYNYRGFELAYSSVLNDVKKYSLILNDTSRLLVNGSTLNHYNVIDSRAPIVKFNADWIGPPDIHFLSAGATLYPGTPIMKLTMDITNAQIEYNLIPGDSDVLNNLTNLLNDLNLPLRLNHISYDLINQFRYAIYSCIPDFLESTSSGAGSYLSIACDGRFDFAFGTFTDAYNMSGADTQCGISLQPFILNDLDNQSHLNENDNERDRLAPIGVLLT